MTEARRTFIVRVHDTEIVIEDVRARRRVRVAEVQGVGAQIAAWLADGAVVGSPRGHAAGTAGNGQRDGAA